MARFDRRSLAFAMVLAIGCSGDNRMSGVGDDAVLAVDVMPDVLNSAVGDSFQFLAMATRLRGDRVACATMLWASSDTAVIHLASATGAGEATGEGQASVIGRCGGTSDTAQVIVAAARVASVEVSPSSAAMIVGTTQQFSAALRGPRGRLLSRPVTWSSSNPASVTISSSGVATAIQAGSATITATSEGVTGTAVVSAAAPATAGAPGQVTDLAVIGATESALTISFTEVHDGAGGPANYEVRYAIRPIQWGSAGWVSAGACAAPIDGVATGAVRTCTVGGLAPETAYDFQAVAFRGSLNEDAVFGALSNVAGGVTTMVPAAAVALTPSAASIPAGQTVQFVAVAQDAGGNPLPGRPITWSSSDTTVVGVDAGGLAIARREGSATISARSNTAVAIGAVTVTAPPVAGLPGAVVDLAVASIEETDATVSFTEVDNGLGGPSDYEVRYGFPPLSWGPAGWVTSGTCMVPITGTQIGARRTCTIEGLTPGTTYEFQLVAFRGVLNQDAVFGPLSNLATGTTAAPAVASVTVAPASSTVSVGQSVQLTATARDAAGNVIPNAGPTWSSSAPATAVVSPGGLATGVSAGSAMITVSAGGKTASAAVAVSTAAPYPNLPAGFTAIAENAFASLPGYPANASGITGLWWLDPLGDPDVTLVSSNSTPRSPGSLIQTRFPSGFAAGAAPGAWGGWDYGYGGTQMSELYVSMWIRIPGTDYENQLVGTKIAYMGYARDASTALNDGYLFIQGNGTQTIASSFQLQYIQQNNVDRTLRQNIEMSNVFTVGDWHHFELVFKLNTLGSANGTLQWWVDGRLIMSHSDVVYIVPGATSRFQGFKLQPVWGGLGGVRTRQDFMQVDHIYIAGRP